MLQKFKQEQVNFKLTEQSFEKLRNENIPDNILESLKTIEKQEFLGESDFLNAVEKRIGKEQTVRHKELILKYAKKQDEEEQPTWTPDARPDDVEPIEDETPIKVKKTKDLSSQGIDRKNKKNLSNEENQSNDTSPARPKNIKEIGDWGERHAKKYLENKYPNSSVIWLNENSNTGEGYDFIIKNEQGDEVKYYEIKAKTTDSPESVEITKTQWGWAKRLHDEGNGEKYVLLVIANAGTHKATLKLYPDPVKLWKEGKIEAHPVSLEL